MGMPVRQYDQVSAANFDLFFFAFNLKPAASVRVIFDARPFAAMFAKQASYFPSAQCDPTVSSNCLPLGAQRADIFVPSCDRTVSVCTLCSSVRAPETG